MRPVVWISGVWLVVASQAVSLGCGDSGPAVSCDEGGCECRDQNTCNIDCEDRVPCDASCLNFGDLCDTTCTDDCQYVCRGGDRETGLCRGECGVNCSALCSSVANCVVFAGPDSQLSCINATSCNAAVGDGSVAQCIRVAETCTVRCAGTCQVACDLVGACNVDCGEQERRLCDDGFYVCGMECPDAMPMMMPIDGL